MVSSTTNTTPSMLAGDEGVAGGRPNRCPRAAMASQASAVAWQYDAGVCCFCWLAGESDTMRRIHDAVGVDPIDFESGYPKLV
jgi:hypothetical protein